jgi:hypothetical protein
LVVLACLLGKALRTSFVVALALHFSHYLSTLFISGSVRYQNAIKQVVTEIHLKRFVLSKRLQKAR